MTDLSPLLARAGANDVDYIYPGLPGRQIVLRSARPKHCTAETPVLFVHHGVNRNGADYRDYWLPLVDEADLLVIAPEFPNEGFPGAPFYNFGNLRDAEGRANPSAAWSYGVDGAVFALLRGQGLTRRERFGLWGHSAGGQFVHRMISMGLTEGVAAAVTANAGTYAMPDPSVEFPFGLGGLGLNDENLRALLQFRLTVMAGTADIDSASEHFPKDAAAMAQGGTRYERAHRYIATARAQAARLGMQCAWTVVDVTGVDHDGQRMSVAAAPVLSAALHA